MWSLNCATLPKTRIGSILHLTLLLLSRYLLINMGWFSNLSANQKINRRISDLEEDFEIMKRTLRKYDLEFSESYEKVRHALSRLAKRSAMLESSQEPEEEASAPLADAPSDGLSPQQQAWNQRILAARMMRGN